MPAFYGAQVRGGVTVPLNADSRGPLLQQVIEHSDVEAIVVRADLVDRLEALPSLGRVRLVVVVGDGPLPDARTASMRSAGTTGSRAPPMTTRGPSRRTTRAA